MSPQIDLSDSPASPGPFSNLPTEILDIIFSKLTNRDIKNLRLTCSFLRASASLRLDRVFLSANPRNIAVLRSVAEHEHFRKGITEIIWDDAILRTYSRRRYHDSSWSGEYDCPEWFRADREENLQELENRKGNDADRPDHIARAKQCEKEMTIRDSWEFYRDPVDQQEYAMATGADEQALKYALDRFPSLNRITITPATHGFLFAPLYETPMIRSFPYGFNYSIPRGWPMNTGCNPYEAPIWNEASELVKDQWRGFRIITRVLAAQKERNVPELVIDVHGLETGLNCHIFSQPCAEYNDFVSILERPGFRRLDLSLSVGGLQHEDWVSYRSGYLRKALSKATSLESITLHSDIREHQSNLAEDPSGGGAISDVIPLCNIFPIETWSCLRHFGLSRFLVIQDDLISFLSALPGTIKSVELSLLLFADYSGNYWSLLYDIRDKLDWRERETDKRPKISLAIEMHDWFPGRYVWVDEEVQSFIYDHGENPFRDERGTYNEIMRDYGIWRDGFEPAYERPNLNTRELARLGIVKISEFERNIMGLGLTMEDMRGNIEEERELVLRLEREQAMQSMQATDPLLAD